MHYGLHGYAHTVVVCITVTYTLMAYIVTAFIVMVYRAFVTVSYSWTLSNMHSHLVVKQRYGLRCTLIITLNVI